MEVTATSRRLHVVTSPRRDVATSRRLHVVTWLRRDVRSRSFITIEKSEKEKKNDKKRYLNKNKRDYQIGILGTV